MTDITPLDLSSSTSSFSIVQKNYFTLPRRKWLWVLGGVAIVGVGVFHFIPLTSVPEQVTASTSSDLQPIAVKTQEVQPTTVPATLELSGTIHPVDQATLSTRVTGRITQLNLESGDRFHQGDILARIDVMDIAAQTQQAQAAVAQAESGVAQRQADLSQAEANLNQYQAQKIEAKATLDLAAIDQKRTQTLYTEGAVAKSQLDQANTTLAQAKARLSQVEASIAQAQAGIRQSEDAIEQAKAAVHQAKSGVTAATVSESYGTIVAPFDGVVVDKLAYVGEMAAPGTPLLKIENPHHLQLEVAVPEENLRFIQVGKTLTVKVDAAATSFTGTIAQIVPTADPNSRSFIAKIPLDTSSNKLISGMFGRISLPLGTSQKTILVPQSALIKRGQLQGVYTAENHSNDSIHDRAGTDHAIAVLHWVKTGQTHDQNIEILSGLNPGDRIITEHPEHLSDGEPIVP